jgi:hypothetical protein
MLPWFNGGLLATRNRALCKPTDDGAQDTMCNIEGVC